MAAIRKVSVDVTADPAGAVAGFQAVSDAANAAADEATAAGDRVAAAAVRQADTAAQAAARAAKTAATESQAAADAFADGDTAAYDRASAAAEAAAAKAQAAWERADAAAVKAAQEASDAQGTAAEEAAAKASEAAKASAVSAREQWTVASAAASDAAGLAASDAERDAGRFGSAFEDAANKTGGIFSALGSSLSNWGLPFGESVGKIGEKFQEAQSDGERFQAAMVEVGKVATLAGLAGFAVAAGEAVKLAGNYQQATASLASHADISVAAATKIGAAFLSTGGKTTFTAQQMMESFAPVSGEFETMYGHALNAAQSLTVMQSAMDVAEASGDTLAAVTKAVADAMRVYHLNTTQAASAGDTMFNTARGLGVTVADLGSSLDQLEPRITGSGMSLAQTGGFLLELAQAAGSGRQAMRLVGTAVQSLITPSASAQKALDQMGVSLTDKSGKFVGMTSAVGQLHTAFSKLPATAQSMAAAQKMLNDQTELATLKTEPQTKAVKAQEAELTSQIGVLKLQADQLSQSSAMQAIFGKNANLTAGIIAGGVPAFDAASKAAGKMGTAQSGAQAQAAMFHGQIEKLKSAGEDLEVELGEKLIPVLGDLANADSDVIGWFEKHTGEAKILAGVVASVLTAAIGAFAAEMTGNFVTSLAEGMTSIGTFIGGLLGFQGVEEETAAVSEETGGGFGPIGMAIGLLVPLLYELVTHWKTIWAHIKSIAETAWHFLDSVWQSIDGDLRPVFDAIKEYFLIWWDTVSTLFTVYVDVIRGVLEVAWAVISGAVHIVWDAIKTYFKVWWDLVKGIVSIGWDAIKTVFDVFLDLIQGKWGAAWDSIKSFFSTTWHTISSTGQAIWGTISGFFTTAWATFKGTAKQVWGDIVSAITGAWDGLKSGAKSLWSDVEGIFDDGVNAIIGVINLFIKALDVIPGVNIHAIAQVGGHASPSGSAAGGTAAAGAPPSAVGAGPQLRMASGGVVPVGSGLVTNVATAVVGEGGPHPEYVIPTDPKYRANAHALVASLVDHIGLPMMHSGGIFGDIGGAVASGLSTVGSAITSAASDLAGLAGQALAAAAGPVIDAAVSVADAGFGALPSPVRQMGEWGVQSIADAVRALLDSAPAGATTTGTVAGLSGFSATPVNQVAALGQQLAAAHGWTGAQWTYLNDVVMRESGWNMSAQNPTSSAFGIAQFINGPSEYAQYGGSVNSAAGQITALINYIAQRYGTPAAAWAHEMSAGWYDSGGMLPSGPSMALNFTGAPEFVFTPTQLRALLGASVSTGGPGAGAAGAGVTYAPVLNISGVSDTTVASRIRAELEAHDAQLIRSLQAL